MYRIKDSTACNAGINNHAYVTNVITRSVPRLRCITETLPEPLERLMSLFRHKITGPGTLYYLCPGKTIVSRSHQGSPAQNLISICMYFQNVLVQLPQPQLHLSDFGPRDFTICKYESKRACLFKQAQITVFVMLHYAAVHAGLGSVLHRSAIPRVLTLGTDLDPRS